MQLSMTAECVMPDVRHSHAFSGTNGHQPSCVTVGNLAHSWAHGVEASSNCIPRLSVFSVCR